MHFCNHWRFLAVPFIETLFSFQCILIDFILLTLVFYMNAAISVSELSYFFLEFLSRVAQVEICFQRGHVDLFFCLCCAPTAADSKYAHGSWWHEPKWPPSSASSRSQHALWGYGQRRPSSPTYAEPDEWTDAWYVSPPPPQLPCLVFSLSPFPSVPVSLWLPSNTTELWGRSL